MQTVLCTAIEEIESSFNIIRLNKIAVHNKRTRNSAKQHHTKKLEHLILGPIPLKSIVTWSFIKRWEIFRNNVYLKMGNLKRQCFNFRWENLKAFVKLKMGHGKSRRQFADVITEEKRGWPLGNKTRRDADNSSDHLFCK